MADVASITSELSKGLSGKEFDLDGSIVTLDFEEGIVSKLVLNNIKQADALKVDYDNIPSSLLNIYINSEIKTGEFLKNPNRSFANFVSANSSFNFLSISI